MRLLLVRGKSLSHGKLCCCVTIFQGEYYSHQGTAPALSNAAVVNRSSK